MRLIKEKKFVVKEILGIENFRDLESGAVITCNHFNPFDNYAVYKAIEPYMNGKMLYKIIREGNYTSFGGFYGYLFRHCNTLPLSSSLAGMKALLVAVGKLFFKSGFLTRKVARQGFNLALKLLDVHVLEALENLSDVVSFHAVYLTFSFFAWFLSTSLDSFASFRTIWV